MTFPLLRLPPELLDTIINHASTEDLKSLTLTNHLINEIATKKLCSYWHYEIAARPSYPDLPTRHYHHMQHLYLNGNDGARCDCLPPFAEAHWIERFPNLKALDMLGTYDTTYTKEERYVEKAAAVFRRMSLETPVEGRIVRGLQCLNLNIWGQWEPEEWLLGEIGVVFCIDSLRELSISGVHLLPDDPKIDNPEKYHGQTQLEMLDVNDEGYEDTPEECAKMKGLAAALDKQRHSLEVLEIQKPLKIIGSPPIEECTLDLSGFPKLEEYIGPYRDSSGIFK
ncbi:hypothetical protein MW887_004619 [Aspergillus wentii]|nr:hypothetical protein MW887_004619 [Aspergillus wentii]